MSTLAALRAKLMAQESKSQQNQAQAQASGDNSIYPHWNLTENGSSTLRFLPDKDPENVYFWVERNIIKLPFPGVKGQNESKEVIVQVPCIEMYGPNEKCPILAEVRTWYKDESLKETANKYWKKRTYLYQGFVRQNGLAPDKDRAPENPIRRFIISPQIHKIIKSSLLDPEFDIMPVSYDNGLDFKVVSTVNGKWNEYVTSNWVRRESPLTDSEQAAIDLYGLYNLKDYLPKRPSDSEMRVIRDMFEASVDGRMYDPDRWGAYYKPWGLQIAGGGAAIGDEDSPQPSVSYRPTSKPVVSASASARADEAEAASTPPWEEEPAAETTEPVVAAQKPVSDKANDILNLIRSKQLKRA